MLCVLATKVVEVERDFYEQEQYPPPRASYYPLVGEPLAEHVKVTREVLEGHKFINARGEQVCIGWSKQTEQVLGLPLQIFNKQRLEIEDLEQYNAKLKFSIDKMKDALLKYESASLFQRLKLAFLNKGFK